MSASHTTKLPVWLGLILAWPVLVFRRLKFGYSFRKIYLGDGFWTIVDPADYHWIGKFKWIYWGGGKNNYAVGELKIGHKKTKKVYMHRLIMRAPKGKLVDHGNGDGLDNRRANLRLATRSQNMMNRSKTKKKTSSRYIGVCFDKGCKRWRAAIRVRHKQRHLGSFKSEIAAACAYDNAARKYHKEFARLNFPEDT